jgi:hypothetical protein
MDNITFQINKDYQSLLPPLSEIEFCLLKQAIKEDGLHIPIIINKHGVILDGHHRFRSLHRCYPSAKRGEGKGISDNCEKDRCIYCHIRERQEDYRKRY